MFIKILMIALVGICCINSFWSGSNFFKKNLLEIQTQNYILEDIECFYDLIIADLILILGSFQR